MTDYRLTPQTLLEELVQWNTFLKRKVHLIACGGTALTLLGVKDSTKDVDFMVPNEKEHNYLVKVLKDLGYQQTTASGWAKGGSRFIFDLFKGNFIHTTQLLESPLKEGNHKLHNEFSQLYIGILNAYDLIASKLFRGTNVDFEDCLMLIIAQKDEIDIHHVEQHFKELAKYDISEERLAVNLEHFIELLKEKGLYD